jgi:cobalt/nickel transport system permease protein
LKHSFLDKHSDLVSPIHRIDPRAKLITAFSAILIIVSEPRGNLVPFAFYGLAILWVAAMSKIPPGYILKRCLAVLPFIIIAAVSYPFSLPESTAAETGHISIDGIRSGLTIFLKALFSLVLLILLASTERFHRLLAGLRKVGIPRLLGVISALMYRYVFILHDELLRTNRARDSRTPGKIKKNRLRVYGNQAAMIFIRSMDRSQVVYNSMLSRGFAGEFPDTHKLRLSTYDVLTAGLFVLLLLVFRIINQPLIEHFLNR